MTPRTWQVLVAIVASLVPLGCTPSATISRLSNGTVLLTTNNRGTLLYAPVGIPTADVSVTGPSSVQAVAGNPVSYSMTVTNAGPNASASVSLVATLPAGLALSGIAFAGGSCSVLPCLLGDIASGQQKTITVTVIPDPAFAPPTVLSPTFRIAGTTWDPSSSNNQISASIVVQRRAGPVDSVVSLSAMSVSRDVAASGVLPDGRVLVAGGGGLTSAEVFDPRTQVWSSTGSMSTSRSWPVSMVLRSGKVLVAGAVDAGPASAEVYDPATGTWSATGNMAVATSSTTAVMLADGRVLVAGGVYQGAATASTQIYDPATGTWTAVASMHQARWFAAISVLADGRVLVAGGSWIGGDLSSAEVYDPAANTWTVTASLPVATSMASATLLANGKVLVAGQIAPLLYDPSTASWSSAGVTNRHYFHPVMTVLADGRVLLANDRVDIYDPVSNTWAPGQELGLDVGRGIGALLSNGTVLLTTNNRGTLLYAPATASVPSPPTGVLVVPGNHSATITWLKSLADGGATILGYTVTASPGGQSCTTTARRQRRGLEQRASDGVVGRLGLHGARIYPAAGDNLD